MKIRGLLLVASLLLVSCSTSTSLPQPARRLDFQARVVPLVNREQMKAANDTQAKLQALDGAMLVITITY